MGSDFPRGCGVEKARESRIARRHPRLESGSSAGDGVDLWNDANFVGSGAEGWAGAWRRLS